MNLKTISVNKGKLLLPAIAAVALIGGVALYRFLHEPDAPANRKIAAQPAYRMQIEGLRFYGMNQGRRVVSIEADRFTLGRGKIGFFSTGLTRKAVIENAIIDVYAVQTAPPSRNASPSAGAALHQEPGQTNLQGVRHNDRPLPPTRIPGAGSLNNKSTEPKGGTAPDSFHAQDVGRNREISLPYEASRSSKPSPEGKLDFGGLFAEETFSSLFPVRNVAEIEVSPVTVSLRNDHSVLTRITAAKASVLLREKQLLFTGQVRVSSGSALMTTEKLVFIPETSRLRTDHSFVLKRGNRTMEGAGLTTDLFLRPQQ